MEFVITKEMRGDQKIAICNRLVNNTLIPVLERYHERQLTNRERTIIQAHVSMLFMEPCPLHLLNACDIQFAENMQILFALE